MANLKSSSILIVLLFLSACASVDVYEYQNDSRADDVYIKQGVDFSQYHSVQIRSISVWYPKEAIHPDEKVSAANMARAQNLFKQVIIDELGDNYKVVDQPAREVARGDDQW